jgi:putative holliday junction resolvase
MRLLALDVGDRTVGVAGCDALGVTTTGLFTVRRQRLEDDLAQILEAVRDREVERILVGLPLNMDGTEGPRAEKTRRFARHLATKTDVPVLLWDERLSTYEADAILRESGIHWKKRKAVIDQVAAEVILRAYLDAGCPPPTPEGPALAVSSTDDPRG